MEEEGLGLWPEACARLRWVERKKEERVGAGIHGSEQERKGVEQTGKGERSDLTDWTGLKLDG